MGEICKKLGEKILGDVVPILRRGANSPDARTRAGVCFAISEVLCVYFTYLHTRPSLMSMTNVLAILNLFSENTTEGQREGHEDDIISAVRICLVDESAQVRVAAAQAFDVLQEYIGAKAIDQTIPTLLEALRKPGAGSGTALQALREIMTVSRKHSCSINRGAYLMVFRYSLLIGQGDHRFPHPYPHLDHSANDSIQCQRSRFTCHGRWLSSQQAAYSTSQWPRCFFRN